MLKGWELLVQLLQTMQGVHCQIALNMDLGMSLSLFFFLYLELCPLLQHNYAIGGTVVCEACGLLKKVTSHHSSVPVIRHISQYVNCCHHRDGKGHPFWMTMAGVLPAMLMCVFLGAVVRKAVSSKAGCHELPWVAICTFPTIWDAVVNLDLTGKRNKWLTKNAASLWTTSLFPPSHNRGSLGLSREDTLKV